MTSEGDVKWSVKYDAYGKVTKYYTREIDNPIRFQGQYEDEEIEFYYNRYRYYNPHTGSFISQDPLRLGAGLNYYQYAPNVWSWFDPLGLSCMQEPPKKIPDKIYRGGTKGNPNHVKLRPGEKAVSFRDSQSNALPELGKSPQPVLRPGRNYIEVDTSKLPPGSVKPDGGTVVDGVKMPHGHVSVTATEEEIVNATIGGGKYPKK